MGTNAILEVGQAYAARRGLTVLETTDEQTMVDNLTTQLHSMGHHLTDWDLTLGVRVSNGIQYGDWDRNAAGDPSGVLNTFIDYTFDAAAEAKSARPVTLILRGVDHLVFADGGDPIILRAIYNLAALIPAAVRKIGFILVTTRGQALPAMLAAVATVVDDPLPTQAEIANKLWLGAATEMAKAPKYNAVLDGIDYASEDIKAQVAATLSGLSQPECLAALRISFVKAANVTSNKWQFFLDQLLSAKIQGIKKSSALELMPPLNKNQVGGVAALQEWLGNRAQLLTPAARAIGLPPPQGMVLVGPPGTGKSIVAKCTGYVLGLPVVRFSIGDVFGSLVGQSEAAVRNALATVDAIAPCVLMIDEMDKGFAGVGGQSSDGGTTQRVFGTFLTWMQERKRDNAVFVVATANNITGLPPELLRKGRFDEVFFVDLPNQQEREEILKIHLGNTVVERKVEDVSKVAESMDNFSGSEIAQAVIEAQITAYATKTPLVDQYLIKAAGETKCLYQTAQEPIDALRQWAKTRARSASREYVKPVIATVKNPGGFHLN